MKKNNFYSVIVIIIEVLVLAQCNRAEATLLTPPNPVSTPTVIETLTATQEQSPEATSTPQQIETGPTATPTKNFIQMSQEWRVAYFVKTLEQICVKDRDENDRLCLDIHEELAAAGYTSPGFLALSPDGSKVAYATDCHIYIWTIGMDVVPLREDGVCGYFRQAKWSPDSSSIAYISEELHRTCPYCQSYFGDLFISSLDGTVHRALTKDVDGWSHWPDWSPDGKHIVFSFGRLIQDNQSNDMPVGDEISVIPAEGGDIVNLTNHSAGDLRPQWSPDGRQIAFLSNRNEDELLDLYLVDSGGGETVRAAKLDASIYWPQGAPYFFWLPDGIHMIYGDQLIDTVTGQKQLMKLRFESDQGSWAMAAETGIVFPAASLTPTVSATSTPHCAADWSRLQPDSHAVVAGEATDPPNRVREAPDTDARIIHQVYPGDIVRVLEGPVCADGLAFWKVENSLIPGGVGWTAEGDGKEYFLEPIR